MDATRTGILTFHQCVNYGSWWQAHCLVNGLRTWRKEITVLAHHSDRVNRTEWRCALAPVPYAQDTRETRRAYARKARRVLASVATLPLSPDFELNEPIDIVPCQTVVVGSDEVWNLSHPWYGGCPLFFGQGLRAERLIAYAASCGNFDAGNELPEPWRSYLQRFDAISVRDENSRRIVSAALGREVALVLDPCLQFPPALSSVDPGEPYIAIYGHSFSKATAILVRRWAKGHGYRIISVGYSCPWADHSWIDASPEEFASFLAGAAGVVTNFFHGCVFSILGARPFVCEVSPYRGHKVSDLLRGLDLSDRLVVGEHASLQVLEAALHSDLPVTLTQRLDHLRKESSAFLARALA